jgi:beta-lactamase class D
MREWLEPMGLRRMDEAVHRPGYGNEQIGSDGTTFWLRGPLAISAVAQTRFLSRQAHQNLPFPRTAQQQVVEITRVDAGGLWSLHARTGWQNSPGAGVGWWVGWVQQGRASLHALGVLPRPGVPTGTSHEQAKPQGQPSRTGPP